ncbi:hypothetical protein CFBP4215_04864 [Pseudomonas syringae pv. syringae]|nr:hypothetical protein CFBP4215_04864 [Pseudomonas syringae pv. syringae]
MVGLTLDLPLFGNASAQAVVLVAAGAFHLTVSHGLGFDQAVFAVVGEGLPAHDADDFLDQVAPRVVLVFVVAPLLEAVVFDAVEAAGVEVQAVAGGVVAEFFAVETFFGVVFEQAAVGFVFVGDSRASIFVGLKFPKT